MTTNSETGATCDREARPTRRGVLAVIIAGTAAIGAGALGLVAGFLSNALGRKPESPWMRIGLAEDLDPETFQKFVVREERHHAWVTERKPRVVYVKDLYPADPLALLSTCSHLGCSVNWKADKGRFVCPCHGGVYDDKGQVVSGPPPRALTQMEIKIENEVCFVRMPQAGGKDHSA